MSPGYSKSWEWSTIFENVFPSWLTSVTPFLNFTQRQCLGLGWTPVKSLSADQASVSVIYLPGTLQSKPPNNHFSRCFQHRNWCGVISSSGWWRARPSLLHITISQWYKKTLSRNWKGSPRDNVGKWEVLWLCAQQPFHPRNRPQMRTVLLNSSELSMMPPPYPVFLPVTYEIQL